MKGIIIAAGVGSRLGGRTSDTPKCLMDVAGRPILDYLLTALRSNGIEDIVVVTGHGAAKLADPSYRTVSNTSYRSNNNLASLMFAEAEMGEGFVASYADIIYDAAAVRALLDSPHDVSIVVDLDWKSNYEGRTLHPESEAEKVILSPEGKVIEVGKILTSGEPPAGEFIGLFRCTAAGSRWFREAFHEAAHRYGGRPFFSAPHFERANTTDLFNFMIERGVDVHAVPIRGGWMEIDTPQDLERARQRFATPSASRR